VNVLWFDTGASIMYTCLCMCVCVHVHARTCASVHTFMIERACVCVWARACAHMCVGFAE
jgi:hypothetical protein